MRPASRARPRAQGHVPRRVHLLVVDPVEARRRLEARLPDGDRVRLREPQAAVQPQRERLAVDEDEGGVAPRQRRRRPARHDRARRHGERGRPVRAEEGGGELAPERVPADGDPRALGDDAELRGRRDDVCGPGRPVDDARHVVDEPGERAVRQRRLERHGDVHVAALEVAEEAVREAAAPAVGERAAEHRLDVDAEAGTGRVDDEGVRAVRQPQRPPQRVDETALEQCARLGDVHAADVEARHGHAGREDVGAPAVPVVGVGAARREGDRDDRQDDPARNEKSPAHSRCRCTRLCRWKQSRSWSTASSTAAGSSAAPRPRPRALSRRARARGRVPRPRRGPVRPLRRGPGAPPAAVGRAVRRGRLARGHRAGRVRRRVREHGRRRSGSGGCSATSATTTAPSSPAASTPGPDRSAPARRRSSRPSSSRASAADDTIAADGLARRLADPRLVLVDARSTARWRGEPSPLDVRWAAASPARSTPRGTRSSPSSPTGSSSPTAAPVSRRASCSTVRICAGARGCSTPARGATGRRAACRSNES